ncbi:MAG TPA: VWA domain-containing protein [Thermoanaerobaculia bacterium]|nr:VWA domain-containing protein [Thermoanaerobaculia bacterium]
MLDRARLSLALALSLIAAVPAATRAQERFGEAVDVNVINVDVYVTDKNGRPVTGLRKEDFELREDGKRVEITNFEALAGTSPPAQAEPAAPVPAAAPERPPEAAAPPPPASDPLHLVVYVDNFNIQPAHRARALQQIREYLDGEVAPGDRVMVVTYDRSGLHVRQAFTDDRAALARALEETTHVSANGGDIARERRSALDVMYALQDEAIAMYQVGSKRESRGDSGEGDPGEGMDVPCSLRIADPIKAYAEAAQQDVLRTIASLKLFVNSLSGLPGRKVLLHVSDGIAVTPGEELFQVLAELCGGAGTTSGLSGSMSDPASQPQDARRFGGRAYQASQAMLDAQRYGTAKDWSELAAHANANRVTLYTLQASGLEAGGASAEDQGGGRDQVLRLGTIMNIETNNRRDSLNVLASDTGGRAIFNANDLRPELARIQQDLDTYYSLGFAPRRFGDGREHRIDVKLKRADLRVRHRRSYRDKSPLERAADRTLAALFYGAEENPLEVSLDVGEVRPAEGRTFSVPLRLRIPLFKLFLQDNLTNLVGKVRLLVATQGAGGATSKVRQVEIPVRIPRDKALVALGKFFQYELTLTMTAGDQRVAVAIQDTTTSQTSYLARDVRVGGSENAVHGQR